MRKIIVLSFLTMDGVMQAPGGPEENTAGAIPAAYTLCDHKVSPNGVIIASYQRAGEVQTGSFA